MRALVLLNADAGTLARLGKGPEAIARVREAIERAGMEGEVRAVAPAQLAEEARAAAGSDEFDAIIPGGGDGTVNTVASAIAGSKKALGVLPLGTLNHFARMLGMPLTLHAAVAALGAASMRAVDLGEVNGRIFLNNASIGLYPRVVGKREEFRRRLGRGKWMAMLMASLWVFRRFPTVRVRIHASNACDAPDSFGQGAIRCDTPFVFVGNNRYEMALLSLGERRCLDRGELGLYFSRRFGRLAMLRLALRTLLGRLEQTRDFEAAALPECWIETPRHHVHVALDGEVHRLEPPLHFRSRPGALRVLAPPGFGASCEAESSMQKPVTTAP